MTDTSFPSLSTELAHRVECFEAALAADPGTDFARFLPEYGHPLYLPLLAEFVRIDLEHVWGRGGRKRLTEYATRFPALFEDPDVLRAVAFEEYRQRLRAGEAADPDGYRLLYGIDTTGWAEIDARSERPASSVASWPTPPPVSTRTPPPLTTPGDYQSAGYDAVPSPEAKTDQVLIRSVTGNADQSDSVVVSRMVEATASLPEPGTEFLGFKLTEELGRGAFGRVYLAHQGDLAGRPVALKIACDIAGESRTLAQLQHTNIVPIYSFHRAGPFQAVCMPYFGRTTLDRVVRHISGRPSLPHSGKELRSTLNQRKEKTAPATRRAGTASPVETSPDAAELFKPDALIPTTDGWGRLEGMPYVDAVLSIGGQLADGLAHAHARGILHRDLKPANVLLTDEGRPMLLDFNLAEDTKLRNSVGRAAVGGTLPYMAPEHIDAFRTASGRLDARCDVFSLGVVLFELLTGRHPYPVRPGAGRDVIGVMLADRRRPAPMVRDFNPAVSPAAEAIVRKCLASNPAERYQSAEDLRVDIDRHLNNQPLRYAPNPSARERLRKWARRHPRLASSGAVAAVSVALLLSVVAGAVYARERTRGLEARGLFADHQTAFRDAQVFLDDRNRSWPRLDEGLDRLRGVLGRYGVTEDGVGGDGLASAASVAYLSEADQARVRQDIGEVFYLMAQVAHLKATAATDPAERSAQIDRAMHWNALAERHAGDRLPRAVREQRAALAELRGESDAGQQFRAEAVATPAESARDRFLVGTQLARSGRFRAALPHLSEANQLDPENFSAWFVRGTAHLALEQNEMAAVCFGACVALRPDFAPAWLNRGVAFTRLHFHDPARADFDRAVRLDPNLPEAYVLRAAVRDAAGDLRGAEDDLTKSLAAGAPPVRVLLLRAAVRDRLPDPAGARADRTAGLRAVPADEASWVARGETRKFMSPDGALADAEEALKLNPMSMPALQLKAHVLAERLGRPADALAVLDRQVGFYPDYAPARAGRGVLLARAGRRDEAIRDAKDALLRDTRPRNQYQVGCVYALTSAKYPDDRAEAFRLLWTALKTGACLDLVDKDADLDAVRNDPEFQRLVADARALHASRK